MDVFIRIFTFQVKQLGHHQIGNVVFHWTHQEDDALFEQHGKNVVSPFAAGGRYDALTRHLGRGREIPAVGGVVRPGLVIALGGGQ